MNEEDDVARGRFIALSVVRLTGAILAALGLAIVGGTFDLPAPVGYALFAVGLFEALFLPAILARKWKSPPE